MYLEGRGEMQSYSEAAKWFRKAADQGIARAQYNLGVTYAYGKGVQQSDSAAAQWFQKAAKQGHAQAQCILKGDNSRFPYWLLLIMCKEI
jgi:TPR repeat protein